MSVEQYSAVLVRLDNLERQVRWRRVERVLTVVLIAWLLASGPPAGSLRDRLRSLGKFHPAVALRSAVDWTSIQLHNLVTIRPAIDPGTVQEDEHEALRPDTPATVSRAASSLDTVSRRQAKASISRRPSPLKTASAVGAAVRGSLGAGPSAASDRALTSPAPSISVSPATSQPDLRASVREAERSLSRTAENSPKVAASVPVLPSSAAAGSVLSSLVPAAFPASQANPASEREPVAAAPPPNASAALAPITLKALGYAQSSDGAQAVLTDGLTLYVVNEGEEFADRFRVVAIRPEDLEVEDLLTNAIFQLTFGH